MTLTAHKDTIDVDLPIATSHMPGPPKKKRLLSLDVLRGLTIVLMVLVNLQPPPPHVLPLLEHSPFLGFTPADLVFPMFIFVMGLALPLALGRGGPHGWRLWAKVGKRVVLLYVIGELLWGFPYSDPTIWRSYRLTGVLQRQGICYGITAAAYILLRSTPGDPNARIKGYLLHVAFPLLATTLWFILTFAIQPPGCPRGSFTPECCVGGFIDRSIWGVERNYQGAPFDPEGILGHLTASITCWLGLEVGLWVVRERPSLAEELGPWRISAQMLLLASLSISVGLLLNPLIPISKPLWTPTFVLLTGGCSLAALAALIYTVDIVGGLDPTRHSRLLVYPLDACLITGRNPLALYILHELVAAGLGAIPVGGGKSLWGAMFEYGLATWLPNELDGLVWSLIWVIGMIFPVAYLMDRRGLYIKI